MTSTVEKAGYRDIFGRFREILSDPISLMIDRVEDAGTVKDGLVTLHNGVRVPADGEDAYYHGFAAILQINRGVHEPLEEFVFQEVLRHMPEAPVMIELGSYWAHYSMWMQQARPKASNIMVELEPAFSAVGQQNFQTNGFQGEFIVSRVGPDDWTIDKFMAERGLEKIDLLHSDIQGAEFEMLRTAVETIEAKKIDRLMVSTHSRDLHRFTTEALSHEGYRIEVDCHPDTNATATDGFVLAVHPDVEPVFDGLSFLGREALLTATPRDIVAALQGALNFYKG